MTGIPAIVLRVISDFLFMITAAMNICHIYDGCMVLHDYIKLYLKNFIMITVTLYQYYHPFILRE